MARGSRPYPQPASRALSLLLTVLPLILLLVSFVLTTISASSKDWSYRQEYTGIFPDPGVPTVVIHRSPFWSCAAEPGDDPSVWVETCARVTSPAGLCDFSAPTSDKANSPLFCQHLTTSAQLLYTGSALVGCALLVVVLLTGASLPSVIATGSVRVPYAPVWRHGYHVLDAPNHAPQAYFAVLLAVLSALGALALAVGIGFAVTALTIVQFNQGDFFSTGDDGTDPTTLQYNGPWLLGGAVGMSVAAAVLSGVAAFATGRVWEWPRVGAWERREHDHEVVVQSGGDFDAGRTDGVNGVDAEEVHEEAK